MDNSRLVAIIAVVIIVAGLLYYRQHTHTASIELPGGKGVSITTHD